VLARCAGPGGFHMLLDIQGAMRELLAIKKFR
jgi:hypothetical protein